MTGTATLRRWLRRWRTAQAGEAAIIRLWADAAADATFRTDSTAAFDWGRRRVAHLLRPRGFGDVDSGRGCAVALLSTFVQRAARPHHRRRRAHLRAGFLGR